MGEFIICQECGEKCSRIYGAHLKKHGISSEEYKKKYPGHTLSTKSDKLNTTKMSGKHMKEEKYRKMFSDKIKGDKNPNHRSKTTDEERRMRSPFSKDFIKWNSEEERDEFISNIDRLYTTQLEYYLNKGYSLSKSKRLLRRRQTTFSLEICIEKFGEEEGKKKWLERQEKWHNNYRKSNFSKISQELFIKIWNIIKIDFDQLYFAKLKDGEITDCDDYSNNEFRLKLENSIILPDFYIPSIRKIIEFDGVYYHRNSPENKSRSDRRNSDILNSGYKFLNISEIEYKDDPEGVVEKCLNFIYND